MDSDVVYWEGTGGPKPVHYPMLGLGAIQFLLRLPVMLAPVCSADGR